VGEIKPTHKKNTFCGLCVKVEIREGHRGINMGMRAGDPVDIRTDRTGPPIELLVHRAVDLKN